jgi:hypothetical protein
MAGAWRRATGLVVVAGGLAAVITAGCSDTPRPINEAKPVRTETVDPAPELAAVKQPEKTDPNAKAVIDAAIAAHTGDQPTLLDKLRAGFTLTRTGSIRDQPPALNPQTWVVTAAWPDRFRLSIDLPSVQMTFCRDGAFFWQHSSGPGGGGQRPMSDRDTDDFRREATGEWLTVLFPLTDPAAVLAPADPLPGGKPTVGVRVWHPHLTDAVVHFEADTKLLTRVTYAGRESGTPVTKEIVVLSRRPHAGVQFPERIAVKGAGRELAEWTLTAVQPLATVEAKKFREP